MPVQALRLLKGNPLHIFLSIRFAWLFPLFVQDAEPLSEPPWHIETGMHTATINLA